MESSQLYISQLQRLLKEKGIEYPTQQQYLIQHHKSQKQQTFLKLNQKPPLQTNIQPDLSGQTLKRYSRQMILKQIQYSGQKKIFKAKIAIIGAGGIGCPLTLYLAAAGVGTLGLFDSDVVDLTNLHRQIGHNTLNLGIPKTKSLKNTLLAINPFIKINQHPAISLQTVHLLDQYDLIIDGSDNPQCRYMVNDYSMKVGKILLSGACVGWQGQITCYGGQGACYRCLWGDDQLSMGGCSQLGVIGMVPGIVGQILAIQAIKLITSGMSSLSGYLLTFDSKNCLFRKMKIRNKKTQCIACGANKLQMKEYNYAKYAQPCNSFGVLPEVPSINWEEYLQKKQMGNQGSIHIDVRPQKLYNIVNFTNTLSVPYDQLIKLSKEQLQKKYNGQVFVSCQRGILSRLATQYLLDNGIKAVDVEGGLNEYAKKYDPSILM